MKKKIIGDKVESSRSYNSQFLKNHKFLKIDYHKQNFKDMETLVCVCFCIFPRIWFILFDRAIRN